MPLFPYTKCRTSPTLLCNHCITTMNCSWNPESVLLHLPIHAVLLPRFEITLTFNVSPWAIFADLCLKSSCLNVLRYIWDISSLPIKGQGARLPDSSANHTISQYYRSYNAASRYAMLIFKAAILNKFEKCSRYSLITVSVRRAWAWKDTNRAVRKRNP